ncbi:MAG: hypothetical protein KGP28_07525 [Bdellovibrionales bacterium]|nr:hypothetical protein [Bdellovibrionales bacterium]
MRRFHEPTMKNLLRVPLVMGVPFNGLLLLSFLVLCLMVLSSGSKVGNTITLGFGLGGFATLRICSRFMIPGWEDELFWRLGESLRKRFGKRAQSRAKVSFHDGPFALETQDLKDEIELIRGRETIRERLGRLKAGEDLVLQVSVHKDGARIHRIEAKDGITSGHESGRLYSLSSLPVSTHPAITCAWFDRLQKPFTVYVRVTGIGFMESKKKVEGSRKRSARAGEGLSNVDSDVTFEEASRVLEAMSRGDEALCEFSMIIETKEPEPELDASFFHIEKEHNLAFDSILGLRKKHFRSHIMRLTTASDLIPTLLDPAESSAPILNTIRGSPLYFSPQDSRLEALHWLVIGASGTGKSFFVGSVLSRMVGHGVPMSVLFVDHNRSFRRFVREVGGLYLEPQDLGELGAGLGLLIESLSAPGIFAGIELSDLTLDEKKVGARTLLMRIEQYLRERQNTHPVYLVLDECWNFIRDEPVLVQRAFREFRKLNGAVIAVTQSLSDFLNDPSGRSILQNTPIRVLLRQGEDLRPYRGDLSLNEVEMERVRFLKQEKGAFSECVIKTSFVSLLGRLYPSESEHRIFRTDNIREELIREGIRSSERMGHA